MVTVEYLRECFDCDFETGILTWKVRPREHFATAGSWRSVNTRRSSKFAGAIDSYGYLHTEIGGRPYLNHRIVFALYHGHWPMNEIDHTDRNRTNNAASNLQEATRRQNNHNTNRNTSCVGVSSHKSSTKLRVRIQLGCKSYNLGYYTNHDDAAKVSRKAQSLVNNPEAFHQFKSLSTAEKIAAASK